MNKFKTTSKYIFFCICVLIIFILLAALFFVYAKESNTNTLAQDESIYKTDFCDGLCTSGKVAKNRTTSYTCEMCHKTNSHKTTNVPKLCTNCAKTTGKCAYCGNILISNTNK